MAEESQGSVWVLTRSTVIPKKNSIFAFSVPLYATSSSAVSASNPSPSTPNVEGHSEASMTSKRTVLDLPRIELELYGNQFCFRSADRASRKFKHKETIEL